MMRLAGRISRIPRFIHRLSGTVYSPELAQLPVFTKRESALSQRKESRRVRVFVLSAGGEPECSEKEDVVVGERRIARAAVDIVDKEGGRQNFDHGTETPTSDHPFSSRLSTNY